MKKMMIFIMVAVCVFSFIIPAFAEEKLPISEQLYIEVSALGSLDYFYDHKLGMELAGKYLGVKTEYVGPADFDMAAMITAFEQAIAKNPRGYW